MKKVALVTGAAGGIGFACARLLLEKGYAVVGMGRHNKLPAPLSGDFTFYEGDLSIAEDRAGFVKTALDTYGRIDVLVNAAGVAPKERRDLLEMTEESYDYVTGINLKGTLFLTILAAREMIKNEGGRKGAIVNISSMSAYTSSVNRGEYCVSKAGVSMLTALFADRLAEYGIPVNEVRPGIIATGMTENVKDKYDALIAGGLLPESRWGQPEDVAKAVWALCGGELTYVTGQSLDVDGGFHIRRL